MFQWLPYPFIRILLFFLAGIITAFYINFRIPVDVAVIICLSLYLIYLIAAFNKNLKHFQLKSYIALLLITFIGFCHSASNTPENIDITDKKIFKMKITGYPEEKEERYKYVADIKGYTSEGEKWHPLNGKILLYVNDSNRLDYGDNIITHTKLNTVESPKNPGEFDYRSYLFYQRVRAQAFISADDVIVINNEPDSRIIQHAFEVRQWVDSRINASFSSETASILKALLVGIRSDMDQDLKKSYAAAGAVHVLAVSGLHVGIVYGILLMCIGWLRNSYSGKFLFAVIALSALWFYAFVTGFSPSILRAVLMFSFIIVAQAINRGSNIYNAIAASAFILLCYNPLLIMNVGFQLSYLAVIGIVFLYSKIVRLAEFQHVVPDRIWQMSVVGIAAQIATFPLALFYFHQFPTYFLLSNLIVIPASTLILTLGLVFLSVQWWTLIAGWIAAVISHIIMFMNSCIRLIEALPMSTVGGIYLSPLEAALLALLVIILVLIFTTRNIKLAWSFVVLSIFFCSIKGIENYRLAQEELVQFYSITKQTNIDFIAGKKLYSYTSDSMADNNYFVNAMRDQRHSLIYPFPEELVYEAEGNKLVIWKNKKFLLLKNDPSDPTILEKIDYLLIEDDGLKNISWLSRFQGTQIIIGTTNSWRYRKDLNTFGANNDLNIYDLRKKALTVHL